MKTALLFIAFLFVTLQGTAQLPASSKWDRTHIKAVNIADTTEIYKALAGKWVNITDSSYSIRLDGAPEYGFRQYSGFDSLGFFGNYWLLESIDICNKNIKTFYITYFITESLSWGVKCSLTNNDSTLEMIIHKHVYDYHRKLLK